MAFLISLLKFKINLTKVERKRQLLCSNKFWKKNRKNEKLIRKKVEIWFYDFFTAKNSIDVEFSRIKS